MCEALCLRDIRPVAASIVVKCPGLAGAVLEFGPGPQVCLILQHCPGIQLDYTNGGVAQA